MRLISVLLGAVLSAVLSLVVGLALLAPAHAARPIEDYASYQPATTCHPKPFAGTVRLGQWVLRHFGGTYVGTSRPCGKHRSVTSEHQTGRAFDWPANAHRKADRMRVKRLFHALFEKDARGNPDARARRMGIMYLIWNDHMYPAWNGFRPEPYLNSGCKRLKKCSATLRHRDHVHVSLGRAGAKGRTSWFDNRL